MLRAEASRFYYAAIAFMPKEFSQRGLLELEPSSRLVSQPCEVSNFHRMAALS